VAVMK